MGNELEVYINGWENTILSNGKLYREFKEKMMGIDYLGDHLKYIKTNKYGCDESAFYYLWYLLVNEMGMGFKFLEIGVYKGGVLSLIELISDRTGKGVRIYGITPLDRSGDKYLEKYDDADYGYCINKIYGDMGLDISRTRIIKGLSQDLVVRETILGEGLFDIVYVDGSHNFEDVVKDIKLSKKLLKIGGYLVMDDASSKLNMGNGIVFRGWGDVAEAIDEELASDVNYGHLFACGHNRVWYKKL